MSKTAAVEARAMPWRWGILAFAVASAIINGFDRQMVAMLKPDILGDFGWNGTLVRSADSCSLPSTLEDPLR